MRKRILYIFIILLLLVMNAILLINKFTLDTGVERKALNMSGDFNFTHTIDSALIAFVKEVNNNNCYFEVYIDKKDVNLTYISFIASQHYSNDIVQNPQIINGYILTHKPSFYENRNGINIFVYTGIEQIINFKDRPVGSHPEAKFRSEHCWTIVLKNNEYNIYKHIGIKPFLKDTVNFENFKEKKLIFP